METAPPMLWYTNLHQAGQEQERAGGRASEGRWEGRGEKGAGGNEQGGGRRQGDRGTGGPGVGGRGQRPADTHILTNQCLDVCEPLSSWPAGPYPSQTTGQTPVKSRSNPGQTLVPGEGGQRVSCRGLLGDVVAKVLDQVDCLHRGKRKGWQRSTYTCTGQGINLLLVFHIALS